MRRMRILAGLTLLAGWLNAAHAQMPIETLPAVQVSPAPTPAYVPARYSAAPGGMIACCAPLKNPPKVAHKPAPGLGNYQLVPSLPTTSTQVTAQPMPTVQQVSYTMPVETPMIVSPAMVQPTCVYDAPPERKSWFSAAGWAWNRKSSDEISYPSMSSANYYGVTQANPANYYASTPQRVSVMPPASGYYSSNVVPVSMMQAEKIAAPQGMPAPMPQTAPMPMPTSQVMMTPAQMPSYQATSMGCYSSACYSGGCCAPAACGWSWNRGWLRAPNCGDCVDTCASHCGFGSKLWAWLSFRPSRCCEKMRPASYQPPLHTYFDCTACKDGCHAQACVAGSCGSVGCLGGTCEAPKNSGWKSSGYFAWLTAPAQPRPQMMTSMPMTSMPMTSMPMTSAMAHQTAYMLPNGDMMIQVAPPAGVQTTTTVQTTPVPTMQTAPMVTVQANPVPVSKPALAPATLPAPKPLVQPVSQVVTPSQKVQPAVLMTNTSPYGLHVVSPK